MPHTEAQAWWADVQHVRETIERRRAGLADVSAPHDAGTETRFDRRAAAPLAVVDDLDWAHGSATRSGGRSDHTGRSSHGDGLSARPRRPGGDAADRRAARWRRDDDRLEPETRRDHTRRTSRRADEETFEPRAAGRDEVPAAPPAPPS